MTITPTSLTIAQLLGSQNEQYIIPAYQRRYSWRFHQILDLWEDISILEGADTHLLGTIVCLTGQHTAGINRLELVDGQQRLTTISILLYCVLERLRQEGESAEAQDLERLLSAKPLGGVAEPKIALDSLDSKQFAHHVSGATLDNVENRRLEDAFYYFKEWIAECELKDVGALLYKLKNQAVIIRLDVSEAKDAFKLFETINNRGLRLSVTDIIKNFILGNAARFGHAELTLARDKWSQLIKNLDGISTEAFLRQFMVYLLKKRVTNSSVVEEFQSSFMAVVKEAECLPDRARYCDVDSMADTEESEEDAQEDLDGDLVQDTEGQGQEVEIPKVSFSDFIDRLINSSRCYREIFLGLTGKPKLDRRLRNLRLIKSMQSYGFLMSMRVGGCSDADFEEILKITESFLLRRHICRERTSENETVFARLCAADPNKPLDEVRKEYRGYCPNDEKFREEFATTRFNSSLIERARYCLEQIEMHQHGDYLEMIPGGPDTVHVEHIIPQKITTKRAKSQFGDWITYLGPQAGERHTRYISRIGNLSLFAGELNITASNNPYERKKDSYKSSAIKLTNSLPRDYPEFRFEQVEERSQKLAKAAVKLWPVP